MERRYGPTNAAQPETAVGLLLRPFVEADRPAILEIFDANVPAFFAREERGWLEDSLGDLDGPAFVVTVAGEAAAFGGYEIWDYYDKALLYWGMAHPRFHGRGLGRWLLAERLALIAEETPSTRWVTVDTSPTIAPFFLSQGFETASVWPMATVLAERCTSCATTWPPLHRRRSGLAAPPHTRTRRRNSKQGRRAE